MKYVLKFLWRRHIMNKGKNSPYSAAITGCGFQMKEFISILPLLESSEAAKLLREEVKNNNLLQVNSQTSRDRFVSEFKKRFAAVPRAFWNQFLELSENGKKAAYFYAILKTYKLLFDFHFNVTIKNWDSIDRVVSPNDIFMNFSEISANDEFVDSWSELTKNKCVSQYLTILRQVGLISGDMNELSPLRLEPEDCKYYINSGEEWFLEACLLYPYEIADIKSKLK